MPTRDSIWLWVSLIGAIAVALSSHFSEFPWISTKAQHIIELISFIWSVVSAKMMSSPLKHSEE